MNEARRTGLLHNEKHKYMIRDCLVHKVYVQKLISNQLENYNIKSTRIKSNNETQLSVTTRAMHL